MHQFKEDIRPYERNALVFLSDPFLMAEALSEDERMIQASAEAFAQNELMPRVNEAYLGETVAPELFKLMGQAGLLGVTLPEKYGAAMSYVSYGLVAREVERVDSAIAR